MDISGHPQKKAVRLTGRPEGWKVIIFSSQSNLRSPRSTPDKNNVVSAPAFFQDWDIDYCSPFGIILDDGITHFIEAIIFSNSSLIISKIHFLQVAVRVSLYSEISGVDISAFLSRLKSHRIPYKEPLNNPFS